MKNLLIAFFFGTILIASCIKEDSSPESCSTQAFIAPCSPPERVFVQNTKNFGSSVYHPQAKYKIDLADTVGMGPNTLFQFAFNKFPTTGLYQMVTHIDTNTTTLPNQIAFVKDSGSFLYRSGWSISEQVYVDNTNNQIIISYCNISDNSVSFEANSQTYIGFVRKRIGFGFPRKPIKN